MCKFIGKSNERILCKLKKCEILRLYSIIHVAMETAKTLSFTCQSKSFISIFFTCKVSACELHPFSCHDLANDIYSQTAKTVFNHLNSLDYTYVYFQKVENGHVGILLSFCWVSNVMKCFFILHLGLWEWRTQFWEFWKFRVWLMVMATYFVFVHRNIWQETSQ